MGMAGGERLGGWLWCETGQFHSILVVSDQDCDPSMGFRRRWVLLVEPESSAGRPVQDLRGSDEMALRALGSPRDDLDQQVDAAGLIPAANLHLATRDCWNYGCKKWCVVNYDVRSARGRTDDDPVKPRWG